MATHVATRADSHEPLPNRVWYVVSSRTRRSWQRAVYLRREIVRSR